MSINEVTIQRLIKIVTYLIHNYVETVNNINVLEHVKHLFFVYVG